MGTPEYVLWTMLRNRQIDGYRFRRQHPIGRFIVDFVCFDAQLVIEVDGDSHEDQTAYDRRRTLWLQHEAGFRLLRVTNSDVMCNPDGVYDLIESRLRDRPPDFIVRGGKLRRKRPLR